MKIQAVDRDRVERPKLLHRLTALKKMICRVMEEPHGQGRLKASYKLEVMTEEERMIMDGLGVVDFHNSRPKIRGVSVYK